MPKGCSVRDTLDHSVIRVSLGGGAWGEAVELEVPSQMSYYTLSPESAEDLAEALVSLAVEARANREKQREEFAKTVQRWEQKREVKGEE